MHPRTRGPLGPAELAEAVVLADLSLALTVVGRVLPLGPVLFAVSVVPLAVVGARHRIRAVITGAVAAAAVGFLVMGTAAIVRMSAIAAFAVVIGEADRRGWSARRTIVLGTLYLWPPFAAVALAVLAVFSNLRKLVLDQVHNSWNGFFRLLGNIGLDGIAAWGNDAVDWVVRNWWLSVPVVIFFITLFAVWLTHGLAIPALRRVRVAFGEAAADVVPADDASVAPDPLPTALHGVSLRYPGAAADALHEVDLDVRAGELLAIVGPNGSGKSTLARVVAGRRPASSGRVERPGPTGLGRAGGTAIVFQRPEAQVLGVGVRDDIVWGMDDPARVDVDAILARVGLEALADRETSTLSGGELQRLAIAAAVARAPHLLVSDESTAMVDVVGRRQLLALLRNLVDEDGLGIVHITHHPAESALADRTVTLEHGRVVDSIAVPAPFRDVHVRNTGARTPVLTLEGVGHVYSPGTPWEHRALTGVDLEVAPGETLLVVGHNGSGKSTLAWIVSGLLVPSEGTALLDGEPIDPAAGHALLTFQHARLQLLRPIVLDELRTSAGVEDAEARQALRAVGLDPTTIGHRRVDELSGGQLRRVALAGVLARQPRLIVLDEPFAGLDTRGRDELHRAIDGLRRTSDLALVIVSHDRDLPPGLIDRIVELEAGRIVRDDPVVDEATT